MKLPGVSSRQSVSSDDSDGATPVYGEPVQGSRNPGVCREDFEVLELLGEGGFGAVKLVKSLRDGQLYAMKAMEKAALHERSHVGDRLAGDRAKVERDIGVAAREWKCPFIVELCAAFQSSEKLYYVFEYCPAGDLLQLLLAQANGRFDEATARFFSGEICLALEHLHGHDAVHRDVRLENILVAPDGHAKLTDFGCAKADVTTEGGVRPSYVFQFAGGKTEVFFPPEFCQMQVYGKDLDCWQLGVALFYMLTGSLPSPPDQDQGSNWPGDLPQDASEHARDLLAGLLERSRARRLGHPAGARLLRPHAFFQREPHFWQQLANKALQPPLTRKSEVASDDEDPSWKVKRRGWHLPTIPGLTGGGSSWFVPGFSFAASTFLRARGLSRSSSTSRSRASDNPRRVSACSDRNSCASYASSSN